MMAQPVFVQFITPVVNVLIVPVTPVGIMNAYKGPLILQDNYPAGVWQPQGIRAA
jgi:hypothetical protein